MEQCLNLNNSLESLYEDCDFLSLAKLYDRGENPSNSHIVLIPIKVNDTPKTLGYIKVCPKTMWTGSFS